MMIPRTRRVCRIAMALSVMLLFVMSLTSLTLTNSNAQELVVNRKAEGISLDPAKTTTMEDYMVMENVFSSLFRFKPDPPAFS